MKIDDSYIADARERLRKKAQNEATCFALNDMLKDAQDEVRRLREENERQRFDILAMNQSLDLMREENERLRKDAERIDWISRQDFDDLCIMLVMDADHDVEHYVAGDDNQSGYGPTLREAIDAARGAK